MSNPAAHWWQLAASPAGAAQVKESWGAINHLGRASWRARPPAAAHAAPAARLGSARLLHASAPSQQLQLRSFQTKSAPTTSCSALRQMFQILKLLRERERLIKAPLRGAHLRRAELETCFCSAARKSSRRMISTNWKSVKLRAATETEMETEMEVELEATSGGGGGV